MCIKDGFLTIQWLNHKDDLTPCFNLRKKVFIDEQHFNSEFDELDSISQHLLMTEEGLPIGTARLFPSSDSAIYIVGRICVSKECRGKQIGKQMMTEVEKKAKDMGAEELQLDAQCRVQGFYESIGFTACGEQHYDEHCLHVPMKKRIV